MQAMVGDRLRVHANTVGRPEHLCDIVEVRGPDGTPPYVVRFEDGHVALVYPGGDAEVEHLTLSGVTRLHARHEW